MMRLKSHRALGLGKKEKRFFPAMDRGEHQGAANCFRQDGGFYFNRVARGHRDYCHFGGHAVAGVDPSQIARAANLLFKQRATNGRCFIGYMVTILVTWLSREEVSIIGARSG
jgi:hypothetical protein